MTEPSNAGIIKVGEERIIPGSQRADGSFRKERKVRPGFTPLEDVKRYTIPQNRTANPGRGRPGIPGIRRKDEAKPAPSTKEPVKKGDTGASRKAEKVADLEQKLDKEDKSKDEQQEDVNEVGSIIDKMSKLSFKKNT